MRTHTHKKINRKKQLQKRILIFIALACIICCFIIHKCTDNSIIKQEYTTVVSDEDNPIPRPNLDVQLLTINEYSRPALATSKIKGIVIHYTANPGSTAQNNRDYFEDLKDTHITKASSHFIVGLEGEIIQCIPTAEYAYASNSRNDDTISIETCHINEDGSYEAATYKSLVHLSAWLAVKFGLDSDDLIRHYDITGKNCPKYFVENKKAWKNFKKDVQKYIDKYK